MTITSIFNSTAPLELGSSVNGTTELFRGKLFRAQVRNGLAGPVIAEFRANDGAPAQAQFASSVTGETWFMGQSSPAGRIVGTELETMLANTQRIDFHPVTLERQGVLIERAVTQLALHSADFSSAWWVNSGVTVTTNTHFAPDGTLSGDTVADPGAGWANLGTPNIAVPGASSPVCASVYVRKDSIAKTTRFCALQIQFYDSGGVTLLSRIDLNIATNTGELTIFSTWGTTPATITGYDIVDEGDFWRVWASGHSQNAGSAFYSARFYPAHGAGATMDQATVNAGSATAGSVVLWGAQCNSGARPTSHVPASGSTATRNADVMSVSSLSDVWNPTEGALYTEALLGLINVEGQVGGPAHIVAQFSDGISDTIGSRIEGVTGTITLRVADNNNVQAYITAGITLGDEIVRSAMSFKANDFAISTQGLDAVADTDGTMPSASVLTLGTEGSQWLDGHLRRVFYFPKEFLHGTLQALATSGPMFNVVGGDVPGADPESAIYYEGRLMSDFRVERRVAGRDGIGGVAVVSADASLNNEDGELDMLTHEYSIAGRNARLYVGQPTQPRSTFELVMSGVVRRIWVDQHSMRMAFSDGIARLDRMLNLNVYAGSGGIEGGADLKGKYKPRGYGKSLNISPPLVDPTALIYQVNDGQINDVPSIYDRGISTFTKGADYTSLSDMQSNAPAAGAYRVWKAGGYFRIGATPAGTLTADVEGDAVGSYITKAGAIVKRILETELQLTSSEIDAASFSALDTLVTAPVGIWVGTDGRLIGDVVDDLLAGVGAFGGFSRLGLFTVGRISIPEGAPVATFTEEDILHIERLPLPPEVDPIIWRALVAYQKNYTIQNDFAAAVPAARRTFAAEPFRSEKEEDASVLSRHRLAREFTNANIGCYSVQSDALEEAKRLKRLWGVERSMYRVRLPPRALTVDIGNVITLQHARYRMQSGKQASVLGHALIGQEVELTVLM